MKLGFNFKRKHDPKGFLDPYFKQNHVNNGYVHEEVPDESIYQGVNTFSKFLARAQRKEEQSQILQHQQELKTMVLVYRTMELDILEKVRKDKEEKEAQATKYSLVTTRSAMDKGKGPMEDIPHAYITKHVKTLALSSDLLVVKYGCVHLFS